MKPFQPINEYVNLRTQRSAWWIVRPKPGEFTGKPGLLDLLHFLRFWSACGLIWKQLATQLGGNLGYHGQLIVL